jgi:autotransporter-associated beta strand protein
MYLSNSRGRFTLSSHPGMLRVYLRAAGCAPRFALCALIFAFSTASAPAGIKEDVGLMTLQAQSGNVATGAGVRVSMTEALVNGGHTPMTELPEFTGKHFEFRSGAPGNSAHATYVAQYFFGLTNSIAPGISVIELYEANDYMAGGLLNSGSRTLNPEASPQNSRVGNHSWVSVGSSANGLLDVLERQDWLIEQDDYVQVVGVNNGDINTSPVFSNSFNVISVGRSDGQHAINSVQLGGIYTHYRTRPDIVAPMTVTSFSTPVVAAASALLIDTAHTQSYLSDGSYPASRFPGTTIYHGETSEVVKATLMAGASRLAFNSADGSALVDYRAAASRQATNGLDKRYGAGQLDVHNSMSIMMSGEQSSREDGRAFDVQAAGFDYDPQFGGAGGANDSGSYDFTAGWTGQTLTASLVWNAKVDINQVKQGNYATAATLHDLNLSLYDITTGAPALVATSSSNNQNTENLWTSLVAGRRYRMEVSRGINQAPFASDYALAWSTVGTLGWGGLAVWDSGLSPGWTKGNSPAPFMPGEHVVFNDSGLNGQVAIVGSVAPASVLIDNNLVPYTFAGGAITGGAGIIKRGSGDAIFANNNTYTGPTIVESGWLQIAGSLTSNNTVTIGPAGGLAINGTATVRSVTGGGSTFVGNGVIPATLSTSHIKQSTLVIAGNGQVKSWPNGGTSVLGSLSIAGQPGEPAGKFDLNNNAAIIDYTGASPISVLRLQIQAGRGGWGIGSTWNGQGITSSAAAAANAIDNEGRAIGFAENAWLPLGSYTTFRGQPVDATSVLLAFTRTGDANLDGVVDDDDVTVVGAMYAPGSHNGSWYLGDFDYNGFVDDDDVTLLGVFYDPWAQPVSGSPTIEGETASTLAATVPEPPGLALLLIGGCALLAAAGTRARRSRAAPRSALWR